MTDFERTILDKIEELQAQLAEHKKTERKPRQPEKGLARRAITPEEYREILDALGRGFSGCKPNPRAAAVLTIEANTGLRVSDVVKLRLCDIVQDGGRRRLNITEQKTGKSRKFTVNARVYNFLVGYCYENGIKQDEVIFNITPRSVQRQLEKAVDWLGLEGNIGTHSFRKLFALRMYEGSGCDIALVQELLQHASAETTRRYITVSAQKTEEALEKYTLL